MHIVAYVAMYAGAAAAIGVGVWQYEFRKSFAVSQDGKEKGNADVDHCLNSLDNEERQAQRYWRCGSFFLGLSLANFVCMGAALRCHAGASFDNALLGATVGSLPVALYGIYHLGESDAQLNQIAQQRISYWNTKYPNGWTLYH